MGKFKELARSLASAIVLEASIALLKKLGVDETLAEDIIDDELYDSLIDDELDDIYVDIENAEIEETDPESFSHSSEDPNERVFTITNEYEELIIATNGQVDVYAMCIKVIDKNDKAGWLPFSITKRLPVSKRE